MAKNIGNKKLASIIKANINKKVVYIQELFYILSLSLIIFVIMEIIKPRIVLGYFNLNLILLLWVILALTLLFTKNDD